MKLPMLEAGQRPSLRILVLATVLVVAWGGVVEAGDWSRFRGDGQLTGVAEGDLPPELAPRWVFEAGDAFESAATIRDGVVYAGSVDGHLYALGLVVLARRFGPAWREAPVVAGSTAAFLRSLGVLHRQLGHHPAAARLLDERARILDPNLPFPAETWVPVDDDSSLVTFARKLARAQRRRRVR